MNFTKLGKHIAFSLLTCFVIAGAAAGGATEVAGHNALQQSTPPIEFITAEELKTRIATNQPTAIIDVRATSGLLDSDNKVKGAVYVKLRRLKYRLGFPPLKDVPRNREVVTYCACPNDESSIRAAQVLMESGFQRVRVLKGGWIGWKKAKGQVEPFARIM